jgi:hypothetical protein
MKKQQEKQVIGIDEFDEYVSLNNIIDAGGNAVAKLKKIAESLQYDQFNQLVRFPTLLIDGKGEGKSILGKAFLNTLCLQSKDIDASLLQSYNQIIEFFWASHPERGYLITNIDELSTFFHKTLYEIIRKREYTLLNQYGKSEMRYPVSSIIVMTSSHTSEVPAPLLKYIQYIIHHSNHNVKRRELIAIQRLVNANVKYSQACVKRIANETPNLNSMIGLIRMCLDIIKADYRDNLTLDDVNKAIRLAHGT